MGITKADLFTVEQNDLARVAKVLAHPARLAILEHLFKLSTCINSDLVEELGLAQATISQHLKELKSVGIIKGSIEGNSMNYCIDEENWVRIKQQFEVLFNQFKGLDGC